MNQVEVAVIGTGWCGGIRAETLARSALVDKLHICEIRPDRLAEVKALTKPASATLDYRDIVKNPNISVVYICTTPEQKLTSVSARPSSVELTPKSVRMKANSGASISM